MLNLPDWRSIVPDLDRARRVLGRIAATHDVAEPVSAWRGVPEELDALTTEEKVAFVAALLPLARHGRRVARTALRRLYQLFAFMEMPDAARQMLISSLHTRLRLVPQRLPHFSGVAIRRALMIEARVMAGSSPSQEMQQYLSSLATHLQVKPIEERRWMAFFDHLTDAENRVAAILGKKGHLVRLADRRLELFKKAIATVGVPAAVIFPLGTIGLSAEGITTGLIALGGGFMLPAGIATITGLGVAVALGVSAKKILDMVLPTTDADRFSVDLEQLNAGSTEIEKLLDSAAEDADQRKVEETRAQIASIIRKMIPLSDADRAKMAAAVEQARQLADRYLIYLAIDRDIFMIGNHVGGDELEGLLEFDRAALA